jgi:hypothetical protein
MASGTPVSSRTTTARPSARCSRTPWPGHAAATLCAAEVRRAVEDPVSLYGTAVRRVRAPSPGPAVLPPLRRQCRSAATAYAGPHSRQLPAHPSCARRGPAVVDDHAAPAAGEDRRQDRPPRPIDHQPNRRGHGVSQPVSADPGRHCDTAPNAGCPMLRIGAIAGQPGGQRETRVRMMGLGRRPRRATQHRSVSGTPTPLGSVSSLSRGASDSYHQFCAGETDGHPENVRYARDAGLPGG